mmetsp:Transcript_11567/g.24540  ORF Transcript_11567/g.24540 Transcript_11567/m.24540 type:complete len:122 (+) Transcript_11567:62-427(+)
MFKMNAIDLRTRQHVGTCMTCFNPQLYFEIILRIQVNPVASSKMATNSLCHPPNLVIKEITCSGDIHSHALIKFYCLGQRFPSFKNLMSPLSKIPTKSLGPPFGEKSITMVRSPIIAAGST